MAITVEARTNIIGLVVGMFKAAPGASVLSDLVASYEAGTTIKQMAANLSGTAEFKGIFPTFLTNGEFATKVVDQLLAESSATDKAAAVTALTGVLTGGMSRSDAFVAAIDFVSSTASTNTEYGSSAAAFDNKVAVAVYYSVDKQLSGSSLSALQNVVASVTSSAATVTAANAVSDGSSNVGASFTLTTGVNAFNGGAGADTFIADNTGTTAVTSTADTLDGGAGTDTLNLYSAGAAAALPKLISVEIANIYDQDADITLAAADQASLTEVNFIRGDGIVGYTVGANVTTVGLTDIVLAGDGGATADTTITAASTATAITINTSGVSAAGAAADEDINVVGAALTTVTINALGNTAADNFTLAAAATINVNATGKFTGPIATTKSGAVLNVSGAGAVNIGALDADINTITNTGSGAFTAQIGANVDTVLTSGSGADIITASTTDTIASTDKLAVDGGDGTDVLIIGDANDINTTADGARYTNFETVRFGGFTQSFANLTGSTITAVEITAASSLATNLNATQASAVTLKADAGGSTFALTTATGTADVLNVTLKNTTSTASADMGTATITGFETLNVVSSSGSTADTSALGFTAAGNLTKLNISGALPISLATANITKAVAINAAAMTFAPAAGAYTLTMSGATATGSSVIGSETADSITVSATTGTTYAAGAGNDLITAAVADLVATGANDNKIDGGAGTDTLAISDVGVTLTDNHFTFVSAVEKMTTSTGSVSITTGGSFNTAFADSYTLTTGTLADTSTFALNAGLYSKNVTVTIDGTALLANSAGEDVTVVTAGGDDKITLTGTAWVGAVGASGTITITSGAGVDTIAYSHGTLLATTTDKNAVITAGTGADKITKVGTNSTTVTSVSEFVMDSGDSNAVVGGYDTITGFDISDGTALSDTLNFAGTAAVGTLATTTDYGTILSHSIAAGIASFDDAANYSAAVKINAANLADVIGYLAANTATLDAVAFLYDADSDGTNDSTMVYSNQAVDSLVLLVGVTTADALIIGTNAAGTNDLHIA